MTGRKYKKYIVGKYKKKRAQILNTFLEIVLCYDLANNIKMSSLISIVSRRLSNIKIRQKITKKTKKINAFHCQDSVASLNKLNGLEQ